jgi:hypothetical protein
VKCCSIRRAVPRAGSPDIRDGDEAASGFGRPKAIVVALSSGLALLAASDELHDWLAGLLAVTERVSPANALAGVVLFVLFAALFERGDRARRRDMPVRLVMLFQFALPSEVPGYLLGVVRYSFLRYIAVVAVGELPYAVGTVVLGTSFVQRRVLPFLAASGSPLGVKEAE